MNTGSRMAAGAQSAGFKKQQCSVIGLALGWIVYAAGLVYFACQHRWVAALLWLVIISALRIALYFAFPNVSRFLGYGRVEDKLSATAASVSIAALPATVKFYSFFSCPFCPIVLQRLEALQKEAGFTLEKIDATFKPQILMSKGISSVPVVEVGANRLVGNATTEQLAELIARAQPQSVAPLRAA
jgi:hypothetical protein